MDTFLLKKRVKFHDYGIYINVVFSQNVVQRSRSGISLVRRTERYLAAVSRGAAKHET